MNERVWNFSPGPAVLPEDVLKRAQRELMALPGEGISILEISHRSSAFRRILQDAEGSLRQLLAIPDNYRVLFLQGGARLQFSMVPMNLLRGADRPADYIISGSWGKKALEEARKEGPVRVVWDGSDTGYDRLPTVGDLDLNHDAAYLHFTSNETIEGVQFAAEPDGAEVPLVVDASSDFLSRPLPIERYGLIYACAQKNAGPAGVTIVIVRDDLLERGDESLPGMLNYRNHAQQSSLYNTPPTFAVYLVGLVARWVLEDVGGLAAMMKRNQQKAALLYDAIDRSAGFYRGHARPDCRSLMNVTFRLPDAEMEKVFLAEAQARRLVALAGHRSVGGIRASIYNAMPKAGVEALKDFMDDFREQNRAQAPREAMIR
jgi:phosphoserine aminotransferase